MIIISKSSFIEKNEIQKNKAKKIISYIIRVKRVKKYTRVNVRRETIRVKKVAAASFRGWQTRRVENKS